jgi:hypothetical protein
MSGSTAMKISTKCVWQNKYYLVPIFISPQISLCMCSVHIIQRVNINFQYISIQLLFNFLVTVTINKIFI